MKRRSIVSLSAGAALGAALPLLAQAQTQRVARIGVLATFPPSIPGVAALWKAFYDEMRARGWVEWRNLEVLARYTMGSKESLAAYAEELVAARVDVIVVTNETIAAAMRKGTASIPIVVCHGTFMVETGLVASLSRPGGNVTGVSSQADGLIGKQFELLRALRPDLKKCGVVWAPTNPVSAFAFKEQQAVAGRLDIELVSLPVEEGAPDVDQALAAALRAGVQALAPHAAPQLWVKPFAAWAIEHRIMVFGDPRSGYLMSYWPDLPDLFSLAATFVDRILRGAKPADLPVQQPTKFEFIINAKTAKALGLTIPQALRLRADEVIE